MKAFIGSKMKQIIYTLYFEFTIGNQRLFLFNHSCSTTLAIEVRSFFGSLQRHLSPRKETGSAIYCRGNRADIAWFLL